MEELYYLSSKINTFEKDMVQKTSMRLLLPLQVNPIGEGDISHISWQIDKPLLPLTQLVKAEVLSINLITQLIDDLSTLEEVLEHHLLDYRNINFAPDAIYYDNAHNHFKFCYLPVEYSNKEILLESLIYYLVNRNETSIQLEQLKNLPNTPKSISTWFYQNIKSQKQSKWFDRFRPKEIENTKQKLSASITKHPSCTSMLMDKANPQKFYKLYFDNNVVGRDDTSNIQLLEDSISRKHCAIFIENASFKIKDLESTNGTWLNGAPLKGSESLVNGDIIQLGEKEFIFIR